MPEINAWDTRTGEKVPHLVPRYFLKQFPYLSATPKQKAADAATKPKPAVKTAAETKE